MIKTGKVELGKTPSCISGKPGEVVLPGGEVVTKKEASALKSAEAAGPPSTPPQSGKR